MSGRLDKLLDVVLESGQGNVLDFREIRRAMLRTEIEMDHIYRPRTPLSVELGDIGYIRGDTFVKISNILHEVNVEIIHRPLDHISCSSGRFNSHLLNNGVLW
jgi:hypothetical protein